VTLAQGVDPTVTQEDGRMKLKLLTLAGLCAILAAMSTETVRACEYRWGYVSMYFPTGYSYDTGCAYEGTVQEGFVCTNYQPGYGCLGGNAYYNCGCI
jgi:hypothetical protein